MKPLVLGLSGPQLSPTDRAALRNADPFGVILFKRNCESPEQLKILMLEIKQAIGREDVQILIDEEGGRVSRLQPPHWTKYPPARAFGIMYERDPAWGVEAIRLYARVMAHELHALGITINCAPVVDLFDPDPSSALGDRAFSASADAVVALARAEMAGFLEGGILPIIKHIPGHGRLRTDPHHVPSSIDASLAELEGADFIPFTLLKEAPLAMNSHAVFSAIDPVAPASLSSVVNKEIIRGKLGFEGLLLSDDICMKALQGTPETLAAGAIEAGNDLVLHCSGNLSEMAAVGRCVGPMSKESLARWEHARTKAKHPVRAYDPREDAERLDVLLGGLAFEPDHSFSL